MLMMSEYHQRCQNLQKSYLVILPMLTICDSQWSVQVWRFQTYWACETILEMWKNWDPRMRIILVTLTLIITCTYILLITCTYILLITCTYTLLITCTYTLIITCTYTLIITCTYTLTSSMFIYIRAFLFTVWQFNQYWLRLRWTLELML